MLDHPVTQKVLATVVAAGILGTGGIAWNTRELAAKHEIDIATIRSDQATLVFELKESNASVESELKQVGRDVSEIKTGVAVLQERTERLDAERPRKPGA